MKIFKNNTLCLIVFMLAICSCQRSSSQNMLFGQIVKTIDDDIWAIYQAKNHVYYFGSNTKGMYAYDGNNLINYTMKDGLVGNCVRGFQEDKAGNIFIESPSGVSKFDGTSFQTIPISTGTPDDWQLHADDLWFGCNGQHDDVFRFDGEKLIELKLPRQDLKAAYGYGIDQDFSFNPYSVFGISKAADGAMWFGTAIAGAYRYDGTTFTWFNDRELSILEDGRVPGVRAIFQDQTGDYWLSNSLSRYRLYEDLSYEKLTGLPDTAQLPFPYFLAGFVDGEAMWFGNYGDGAWKYEDDILTNHKLMRNGIAGNLLGLYQDRVGKIWGISRNAGVFIWDGEAFRPFLVE